jgi:hypothetical protein
MAPVAPIDKRELLAKKCRNLPIQHESGMDGLDTGVLMDVWVGAASPSDAARPRVDSFFVRNGHGLEGVLTIGRTAYERGAETAFDGRPNYINKIVFLGTDRQGREDVMAGLVAHAILHLAGDRLFIAEVEGNRAGRVLESLGFTRICISGGKTRYGYLLGEPSRPAPPREAERYLSQSDYTDRLGTAELDYQARLRHRTGFSLARLLAEGWTTYTAHGHQFFIAATFGTCEAPAQAAFKLDLFDMSSGAHVGYADTVVPAGADFALQDDAIADFPSSISRDARTFLEGKPSLCVDAANEARCGWPQREGIWVRIDYRRAGIGQTLERIAGDLCKLAFPGIHRLGVIFPVDNIRAPEFHHGASASNVNDPLYCFEYRLRARTRPLVAIRYGL